MFEVKQCRSYKIVNKQGEFLHSDGSILSRGEYWCSEGRAQAVLDKFQPTHVWEHGDVFDPGWHTIMIYLTPGSGPEVRSVSCVCTGTCGVSVLRNATFLFNIKDLL